MNVDLIVDLQYGSTGKGLLAGYLAEKKKPKAVVNCNMPNAGHTYIDSKGNKMIHKVLPNGVVSPDLELVMLGPGSVINIDRLAEEIEACRHLGYLDPRHVTILVHPNAAVLKEEHTHAEGQMLSGIASTMQGSAVAQVEKMLRSPADRIIARDYAHEFDDIGVTVALHDQWTGNIDRMRDYYILAEGSQGFSLGINERFWPFCTSRDCGPLRLLSDMGMPWGGHNDYTVYGTLRTFPIRVGNTPDGFSGDWYPDQVEKTWGDLNQTPEKTTVTQRERRVATFSYQQLWDALFYCQPDFLFLNFVNYLSKEEANKMIDEVNFAAQEFGSTLALLGFGPNYHDVQISPFMDEESL